MCSYFARLGAALPVTLKIVKAHLSNVARVGGPAAARLLGWTCCSVALSWQTARTALSIAAASKPQLLEGQEGQDECKHQDWSHVHELQTVLNVVFSMHGTSRQLCSTLTLRPIAFVWCSSWPM